MLQKKHVLTIIPVHPDTPTLDWKQLALSTQHLAQFKMPFASRNILVQIDTLQK